MDFTPLNGRVLIERDAPKTSIGGVELPAASHKLPWTGTIVAGDKNEVGVKYMINNRILFNQNAGYNVTLDGKVYRLIRQEDIWGLVGKSINEVEVSA